MWFSQFWYHFVRQCTVCLEGKNQRFLKFFWMSGSKGASGVKKKFQKTLILVFEVFLQPPKTHFLTFPCETKIMKITYSERASHPKNSSYDIGKDWHETSENISYSEFLSFFLLTIEQWQVTFWGSDAWHVPLLYYSLIGKKWFHTSFVRVDMGLSWQLLRQISNYDKNCSDNLMTTKKTKATNSSIQFYGSSVFMFLKY